MPPNEEGKGAVTVERLDWKIDKLSDDLHKLTNSLMTGQLPTMVSMEARIKATEALTTDLKTSLADINRKLDERSKTPWAQWISFAALLWAVGGGIGGICWTLVQKDIYRVEQSFTQQMEQSRKNGDAIRARLDALERPRGR